MKKKRLQAVLVIVFLCLANISPISAADFDDGNIVTDEQNQFDDEVSGEEVFSDEAPEILTAEEGQADFVFEYLPATDTYRVVRGIDKEEVTIPDLYQDKKVSEIGEGAFAGFTKLKKVTIDHNRDVNKSIVIRKSAFEGCANLRQVSVPYGVAIESHAFYGCDKLFSLGNVTFGTFIAEDAFDIDTKVIVFGDSEQPELDARGIYNFALDYTGYEKKAGISYLCGTVTDFDNSTNELFIMGTDMDQTKTSTIGRKAFYGCDNLTSVELPNTVKTIETKAFYGCVNLKKVVIPASVTSISEDAFENTPGVSIYASADSYAAKFAAAHGIPLNKDSQIPETGDVKAVINKNMVTITVSDFTGDGFDCVMGTDVQEGKPIRGTGKVSLNQTGKKVIFRNVPKGVYYLGIRPYENTDSGKKYGEWSEIQTIKISVTTPARPKIKSAKVTGKNLTVNVSLPKGAAGYYLVLGKASVKNDSSAASIMCPSKTAYQRKNQKKTSLKLTNLKKGTYYIGIQTYNYQNGKKVYSKWSPLKSVKIS